MSDANHALATFPLDENVPARLRKYIVWNWIMAIAFCAVTMFTYFDHMYAIKTVGDDAAPSVMASHEIKNDVLSMDVAMTNFLAARPGDLFSSAIAGKNGYNAWRKAVEDQLVVASKNITYQGEKDQVIAVQEGLGAFTDAFQAARLKHESGDMAFLAYYRAAQDVLASSLLPAASKLNDINNHQLEKSFRDQREISWALSGANLLGGLALVWLIFSARGYVKSRFKRNHNAALTACLFLAGGFTFYTTFDYMSFDSHFKAAKSDDFDSIVSLMDARASAYEVRATAGAWLIDSPMRAAYEAKLADKVASVAALQGGKTFADAVAEANLHADTRKYYAMQAVKGSLADALYNLTFPGEKQAAVDTLKLFGDYLNVQQQVRTLETRGQHNDAVALAIGNQPDQAGWAFNNFDQSLQRTLQINVDAFHKDVPAAYSDISWLWWLALIQAVAQVGLFLLGMWPRQKEFV